MGCFQNKKKSKILNFNQLFPKKIIQHDILGTTSWNQSPFYMSTLWTWAMD